VEGPDPDVRSGPFHIWAREKGFSEGPGLTSESAQSARWHQLSSYAAAFYVEREAPNWGGLFLISVLRRLDLLLLLDDVLLLGCLRTGLGSLRLIRFECLGQGNIFVGPPTQTLSNYRIGGGHRPQGKDAGLFS